MSVGRSNVNHRYAVRFILIIIIFEVLINFSFAQFNNPFKKRKKNSQALSNDKKETKNNILFHDDASTGTVVPSTSDEDKAPIDCDGFMAESVINANKQRSIALESRDKALKDFDRVQLENEELKSKYESIQDIITDVELQMIKREMKQPLI